MSRLPAQAEMAKWILASGREIVGKRLLEVGTGHVPLVPIGFYLCGAQSVATIDLHRRIEWGLTHECLKWIAAHRQEVFGVYQDLVPKSLFDERFGVLERCQSTPQLFLEEAAIAYLAPMDAAKTSLPSESVDFHFSVTTLEHIPPAVLVDIFIEANRILKSNGIAIHFVDPTDHFQHQDPTIPRMNFLQFSEKEWLRIAGNEFAYCNRMLPTDYMRLFAEQGYELLRVDVETDHASMLALDKGFPVADNFKEYAAEDLCSRSLRVILRPTCGPSGGDAGN